MEQHSFFSNSSLPPIRTLNAPAFNTSHLASNSRNQHSFIPSLPTIPAPSSPALNLPPLHIDPSPQATCQQPTEPASHPIIGASSRSPPPLTPFNPAQNGNSSDLNTRTANRPTTEEPPVLPAPDLVFVDFLASSIGMDASQRADFHFFFQVCSSFVFHKSTPLMFSPCL